ncbi:MAG TPA: hypothetical protein VJ931_03895, partial [Actinomycetota bacterium]|nr:hypothetical protein [Actinomycetota bacterium]
MSSQRLPWLIAGLLGVALVGTVGWAITTRRPAPASQAATAAAHAGHNVAATHAHGGTAQNTPPMAPRDGVVAMTVPRLPKAAVNFIWNPEHVLVAAGQRF